MKETVFFTGYIFHSARMGHRIQRFSGRAATDMFSGGFTQLQLELGQKILEAGQAGQVLCLEAKRNQSSSFIKELRNDIEHLNFNTQTIY